MRYLELFSIWLKSTSLSAGVMGHNWVWPTLETFHFIGMTMLIGIIGAFDARVLGLGKSMPIAPLHRLLPWGIAGFVINAITGVLFYAGDPGQYLHNPAFQWKVILMILAGINIVVFYSTGIFRAAEATGSGMDAPPAAKVIAGLSIFLWLGVMYLGRMLPYLGNAF